MNTTTLAEACNWMAGAMGLDPVRDRDEVVSYVNKFRNLLYNSWDKVQLFDDYEQCFCLTTYHQDCHGNGCPTYRGFTATLDMGGLMAVWESLVPVDTRSRWREVHRGKNQPHGPEVEIIPLAETYPTERCMNKVCQLRMLACNPKDAGKIVRVEARTADGEDLLLEFQLKKNLQVTVNRFIASIKSVTLPVDLCGNVELFQEDGYLLSVYPPGVPAPRYRRYRVNDSYYCESDTLLVRSARVFVPITEDHEVIEVGDQLVIENAGRYFKYGENTLDAKEDKAAEKYLAKMFNYINNIKDRDRGREDQDGPVPTNVQTRPRRSRRRGLPGYRRI